MDRFTALALWYLAAGICAVGLPLAAGVYSFDRTFGGRYAVQAHSLSEGAVALAFGAIIGALTFVPLHRYAIAKARATTFAAAVVCGLVVELLLFVPLLVVVPDAPFLNGNGGTQLWLAIVGTVAAAFMIGNLPNNNTRVDV